ncbi:MAG: tetratricopeptide repeat protein [Pirellulales bacterium]
MQAGSATARIRREIDAGRWTEAEMLLRAHLAGHPHDPLALRWLGVALRRSGRVNLSIEVLKLSLEHDGGAADAWYELGCSYHRAKRDAEALPAFLRAHELRPTWCDPLLNLGALSDQRGDYAAARSYLEAAARCDPRNALVRYNLGNVLQSQGDLAAAIRTYDKSIALDPTYAKAHWNLCSAC